MHISYWRSGMLVTELRSLLIAKAEAYTRVITPLLCVHQWRLWISLLTMCFACLFRLLRRPHSARAAG
jgi:hypothetical protein